MGRAAKRKRASSTGKTDSVKDFAKKKAKLGRKARSDNATDVTVRTRQIHLPKHKLPEQEPKFSPDTPTWSITPAVVDQHISRANHHNPGARAAAFNALRNLAKSPSVHAKAAVNVRLPVLIAASGSGLADATQAVRRAAGELLCTVISLNASTTNSSMHSLDRANAILPSIAPHILAALSDVRHDICVDAARLLTALTNAPCCIDASRLFSTSHVASQNPLPGLTHILTNSRDPSHRTGVLDAMAAVLSSSHRVENDSPTIRRHSDIGSKFYYHSRHQKTLPYARIASSVMNDMKTDEVTNLARRIAHVVTESLPAPDGGEGNTALLTSAALALAAVAREISDKSNLNDYTGAKDVIRSVLQNCAGVKSLIAEGFGRSRGKESDSVAIALADAALCIGANSYGVELLRKVLALAADRSGRKYMTVRLMGAVQRAVTSSQKLLALISSPDKCSTNEDSDGSVDREENSNSAHVDELRSLIAEISRMLLYYTSIGDWEVTSRILPLTPTLMTACQTVPRLENTRAKLLARTGVLNAVKLCVQAPEVVNDENREGEGTRKGGNMQQNVSESERDDRDIADYCVGEKAVVIGIEVFDIASEHTPPTPISVHLDPKSLGRAMTISETTWVYANRLMDLCKEEAVIRLLSAKSVATLAGMMARVGPTILLSSPVVRMVARGLRSWPVTSSATEVVGKAVGSRLLASRIFLDAMESVVRHNVMAQWWIRRFQASLTVLDNVVNKGIESVATIDNGNREYQALCLGLEEVRLQLHRMWDLVLQEDLYDTTQ